MESYLGGCIIDDNCPDYGKGDIGTWTPEVWRFLIEEYNIKSIIDVGCGAGHSLKYFIDNGIESIGIEGYLPAIEQSVVRENIIEHDYTKGEFFPKKIYDMAWCCEFVEHIDEEYSDNFMNTFKNCKIVSMTHGLPGQPGFHHVNCQLPEYWINRFKDIGFEYLEEMSIKSRSLLPSYTWDDNLKKFLDINNNFFVPNGGHVKNTLMIFKNKNIND